MKLKKLSFQIVICCVLVVTSCVKKVPEMTLDEIEQAKLELRNELLSKTTSKPFPKDVSYNVGKVGGSWYSAIQSDPKTFNVLIAERDGSSASILSMLSLNLVDYDLANKKWKSEAASFEIVADYEKDTLDVIYTLRDDLYWSFYGSDKKVPVTSDDIIFWYNKIEGNPNFASSGYNSQFITTKDGSEKHIDMEQISDKKFVIHFPRIISEPILATNCEIKPSFLYKDALEKGGEQAVKDLFSVNVDVKTLPSCGKWFLAEYTPGQRLVYKRNPDHWKKDSEGKAIPYFEENIVQIVGDPNTASLLFKQGKLETFSIPPVELEKFVENQKDYTVYNSDGAIGASFITFNQNPCNKDKTFYDWFTLKEFRQAMSCLLNRDRIIWQTFRSLAVPKYDFFPEGNPFYNEDIVLKYRYSLSEAERLLNSVGFIKEDGLLYDKNGNQVVFDLSIQSSGSTVSDIAQIITDECSKVGIVVNVRQVDFQKLIEQLTVTYDWQSTIIALGVNMFPSQGANVWPSSGNLHVWNPLQKTPATEWEARVDYLYSEGGATLEFDKAKEIWDEYQQIILEQCPVIYLIRPKSFCGIRNVWDQSNFYFDNIYGATTDYVFSVQMQ